MMNKLLIIFFLFLSYNVVAQQRFPTGPPTQFSTGYFKQGYHQSDSGTIIANRDTNWLAKYSATIVFKPSNKQFYWFDSTTLRWNQFGTVIDTTSLSNRINLKLNITDTTGQWLAQSSRLVDTMYRVNDSTIGYTIKGSPYTFQILGSASGGGGGGLGTVTSVALSMPSAFSVSGSPITTSGTFNISGAGTTAQYIRGNGTLATTDTGMVPNFYLKVRGLLSGTSPITFNQITGAIGINNANTTGIKGAASFTSAFSDNGSGLIDLADIVSTGSCTNCSVTYNAKGQATAFSSGIAPSGSSVDTIFRTPGIDSIYYTINSVQYAIKDSTNPIITANNGLTKTSNNIQWGGTLVQSTTVDGGASFISTFTATGGLTLRALNTSNGNAFYANTTGSGTAITAQANTGNGLAASSATQYGVSAVSTSNLGLYGSTTSGISAGAFEVNPSSTNTSQTILQLKRYSSGTAANGIAGRIEFITEPSAGTADVTSGYIENGWEDATFATRKSNFSLWTTLNGTTARKANLSSTGQWTWDGYPALTAQTDTTTYKPVAIDGSGNVVKMIGWAGSGGGGGGSQTLQQTFDQGSIQTKHDTIYQAGYALVTNGQFINKDTTRSGEYYVVQTYGVSIDTGRIIGSQQITYWVEQVTGAMGMYNWNRAQSGTTLISHVGPADSSMQSKLPTIPAYNSIYRYLIIGNYQVNEVLLYSTDSLTYRNALAAMIDSLHANRGYPLNRIVVMTGTPCPSCDPLIAQLSLATIHVCMEKGVRYFDSYNYLLPDVANQQGDGIHLSLKGQYNLATGVLYSSALDSVQYIKTNNLQVERAATVHGRLFVYKGVNNLGADSTSGNQYIGGTLNLVGHILNNTTIDNGINVVGDVNFSSQQVLLYRNGNERYGFGINSYEGAGSLSALVGGSNNVGFTVHKVSSSDGTTLTPLFHSDEHKTRVLSADSFIVDPAKTLIKSTMTVMDGGLSVSGIGAATNNEWNLFQGGLQKWGMRMSGSAPYNTDVYSGYNYADNATSLGWMDTDGSTYHRVLSAFKRGGVEIYDTLHVPYAFLGEAEINGGLNIGHEWDLYNNSSGNKWGVKMGGSGPWSTDVYCGYNNAGNSVNLGWKSSNGTTMNTVFSVFQTGIANFASLSSQVDTTTYKPLVVNSSGDVYKMIGWPTGGSATTIYNGDGTLSGARLVSTGGNTLTVDGANNSDTVMIINNTGTVGLGLHVSGSALGVNIVSSAGGALQAFGSTKGAIITGDTDEGLLVKSNAVRGARIQTVPASTNTVIEVLQLERGSSGGAGATGIGEYISFLNKTSSNSSDVSNTIISKFTDGTTATRTSQFVITGVNSASATNVLTLDGDGTITTIGKRIMAVTTSSAGTLTLGNSESYIFNGTTTTWTLPAVSGTTGTIYYIKNIGSGSIILNANASANEIYSTSAVNTVTITAGSSLILISNGTYFTTNP